MTRRLRALVLIAIYMVFSFCVAWAQEADTVPVPENTQVLFDQCGQFISKEVIYTNEPVAAYMRGSYDLTGLNQVDDIAYVHKNDEGLASIASPMTLAYRVFGLDGCMYICRGTDGMYITEVFIQCVGEIVHYSIHENKWAFAGSPVTVEMQTQLTKIYTGMRAYLEQAEADSSQFVLNERHAVEALQGREEKIYSIPSSLGVEYASIASGETVQVYEMEIAPDGSEWALVEYVSGETHVNGYVAASEMKLSAPVPFSRSVLRKVNVRMAGSVSYGPDAGYGACGKVVAGEEVILVHYEKGDTAMIEFYDSGSGKRVRGWIPVGIL